MAIATLTVDMEARLAKLQSGLDEAVRLANEQAGRMENAFTTMGSNIALAIAGIGAGLAWNSLKGQFDSVVESLANLDDAAARTGASVQNLSALFSVAKVGGHDLGLVESAAIRLSKALAGADDEAKGAGHALDVLGLKAEELRNLDSADALKSIADAMAKFEDGAGKSALAMDIFGKSGAQVIPYLQDLAELGALNGKVTAEQAAQAEEYEKSIKRLTATKNELYKTISVALLPASTDFIKALVDLNGEVGGVRAGAKALAQDGSIDGWATTAAKSAAFVVDAFDGVIRTFKVTGASLAGVAKDIETGFAVATTAMGAGFTSEGQARIKKLIDERAAFVKSMNDDIDRVLMGATFSQKLQQRMDARLAGVSEEQKGSLAGYVSKVADDTKKKNKDLKEAIDEFQALMDRLDAKDSGVDTKYFSDLQTLMDAFNSGRMGKGSEAIEKYSKAFERLTSSQKFYKDILEETKKEQEAAQKSQTAYNDNWLKYLSTLDDAGAKLEEQVAQYGMSNAAIAQATLARAEERLEIARADEVEGNYIVLLEKEVEARRRIAKAASDYEVLDANKQAAEKAAADWQRVSDDISRALTDSIFAGGKSGWEQLKATIEATLIRAYVQPVVQGSLNSVLGMPSSGSSSMPGMVNGKLLADASLGPLGGLAGAVSGFSSLAAGTSLGAFGAGFSSGLASFGSLSSGMATIGAGATAGGAVGSGMVLGTVAPYLAAGILIAQSLGAFDGPTYHHGGAYQADTQGGSTQLTSSSLGLAGFDLGWGAYGSDRSAGFDDAMRSLSSSLAQQIADSITKYGGDSSLLKVSTRFASDNSDYSVGAIRLTNGADQTLFNLDKHYAAAAEQGMKDFTSDATRALVAALKATDLSDEFDALFANVDPVTSSLDSLNAVLEQAASMQQQISSLNDSIDAAFLTPAERLAKSFDKLGKSVPTSADSFEDLVKAQDLTTSAGREMAAALMTVYPLWGQVQDAATSAAEQTAKAAQDAAAAAASAIQSQRDSLESTLLDLQGNTAEIRRRQLAAIDPANQALQQQIWALQDATQAEQDRTAALKSAQDAANAASQQAAEQLRTAYSREANALQQTIDKFNAFATSLKKFQDGLLLGSSSPLTLAQKQLVAASKFRDVAARAQAGDADALDSLQGTINDWLGVSKDSASSAEEYYRAFAEAQRALVGAEASAEAQAGTAKDQLSLLNDQVSALITINDSVLSVHDAIAAFVEAQGGAATVGTASMLDALNTGYVTSGLNGNGSRTGVGDSGYRLVSNNGSATLYFPGGGTHTVDGANAAGILTETYGLKSGGKDGTLIRTRATGGYTPPGLTWVGEEGPELVNFRDPAMVYTAAQSKGLASSASNAAIEALQAEVAGLRAACEATARYAYTTAKVLDRVTHGGNAMQTEVIT